MSGKAVVHKANAQFDPCGPDHLVDEFEVEEEGSQALVNSSVAEAEETQLEEMLPSLDIDEEIDTTPSLADASASMKRQIQTELKEAAVVPSTQAIPLQPTVTPIKSDPSKACLASTSPPLAFTPTSTLLTSNLPKVGSLQQSPTPPATTTPSRVSKSIVIMDSDGDWTVGRGVRYAKS